ncbi:MAG: nucleotidyltransferase domain-containing protein [Caldilineales bacterium]|nr:nucleotidyltransferase domain-containing protein [Caldilineales bacterium]MDW8316517.1 nucleotidyltransferase domain-containing protein [Anaerolineae bacterium]
MIPDRRLTKDEVEAQLSRLVEMLKPYAAQRIILHGSLARGDWNRASDIDLIIVKETTTPFKERIREVLELCSLPMAVEPLVYTPQELASLLAAGNSFLEKALAEGRVLYDAAEAADPGQ